MPPEEMKADSIEAISGMPVGDPQPDVTYKPVLTLKQINFMYGNEGLTSAEVFTSINRIYPDSTVEAGEGKWIQVDPTRLSQNALAALAILQQELLA